MKGIRAYLVIGLVLAGLGVVLVLSRIWAGAPAGVYPSGAGLKEIKRGVLSVSEEIGPLRYSTGRLKHRVGELSAGTESVGIAVASLSRDIERGENMVRSSLPPGTPSRPESGLSGAMRIFRDSRNTAASSDSTVRELNGRIDSVATDIGSLESKLESIEDKLDQVVEGISDAEAQGTAAVSLDLGGMLPTLGSAVSVLVGITTLVMGCRKSAAEREKLRLELEMLRLKLQG